ncbi:MAG TPA: serine hydrolase [Pirellulales bacterium]|jgi:CubicO group peptidase (beta-lactamase class C family)|nr:serine hydrolase [Pirellulales bacterium]
MARLMTRLSLLAAVLVLVLVRSVAIAADEPTAGLEAKITKALGDWQVPGLAIAIVKDDRVVLAKGFGARKTGEPASVDADTLFAIGSTSKAFTAATLAMLIDEGKLAWDDPVTKHLAGFALYDPAVTRELTVRDLLCHRSGLPRGDALWYGTGNDRVEILRRVRHLKPDSSFRSKFGYQNIMYLAAGEVTARVAKTSWDDFVKERLFLPLGMKSSNTSVTALPAGGNAATPHSKVADTLEPLPWRNIDNVGPAGSINSNVNDMAQWIRMQLGNGEFEGKRLVSAAAIDEMRSPQTIVQLSPDIKARFPGTKFLAYGLGWMLRDYKGRLLAEHGGGIDGMTSQVALVPEEKLGVVILTNRGGTALPSALSHHVFDRFLKIAGRDWLAEDLSAQNETERKTKEAKTKLEASRAKDTKPSLPLEKYAARFTSELYGPATVTCKEGKLTMDRDGRFAADLEHWHYDTFRAKYQDKAMEPQLLTFELDSSGKVAAVEIPELGRFKREEEKSK